MAAGTSLEKAGLRSKYGVTVVGVKAHGEEFTYARPDTVLGATDELLVSGSTARVEAFCAMTEPRCEALNSPSRRRCAVICR